MGMRPVEKFGVIYTLVLLVILCFCLKIDVIIFFIEHWFLLIIFLLYFFANLVDYKRKMIKTELEVRENMKKIKQLEQSLSSRNRR